ncbi:MAG TPA: nitrilase-related carbon-nitrogen hydrolase [Thermoleophilia bacterium]|nr:nitrilase-related carbon-nitrogen hydrolase [Thermoleophilia bacterium]
MRPLTVCAVQCGPSSPNTRENVKALLELTRDVITRHRPDIICLSELATTPYFCVSPDPAWFDLAEPIPGPSTEAFGVLARAHRVHILLPIFERTEAGAHYNSAVLINADGGLTPGRLPDGSLVSCYRKTHIPATFDAQGVLRSHEKSYFSPGPGLPVFDTVHGRIGILICYDKRFTEAWRILALRGAEVVFNPVASWGESAQSVYAAECQVMALYNQVFVVGCGKAGEEVLGFPKTFAGGAHVCAPDGRMVATAPAEPWAVVVTTIDLDEVWRVRRQKALSRDRRPELYAPLTSAEPHFFPGRDANDRKTLTNQIADADTPIVSFSRPRNVATERISAVPQLGPE